MRLRLADCGPKWTRVDGVTTGFTFYCPEHHDCMVKVHFAEAFDAEKPEIRCYAREGSTFEKLSVYPPITHSTVVLVVYEGMINVLEL